MGLLPSSLLDTALYRVLLQQLKLGVYDPHDGGCAWPCWPLLALLTPADDACVASRADAASILADPCLYSTLLLRHRNPYDQYGEELLDAAAHRQLAREAAEQAVVLLGNSHGLLPLRATQRVAVVGPSANERFSANDHGPWDQDTDLHPFYLHIYNGIPSAISTPLAAIEARAAGVAYAPGCLRHGNDTSGIGAAVAAARGADVAVVVVGLDATHEDRRTVGVLWHLTLVPQLATTAASDARLRAWAALYRTSTAQIPAAAPSSSRWRPARSPFRRRSTSRLTPSSRRVSTPNPNQEEDIDRVHGDDNMWSLPGVQAALLEAVVATGTPTVLVCCDGGCSRSWVVEATALYVGCCNLTHPGCNPVHPCCSPMASQVLINGGPLALREPRGGALVEALYGGQATGEGLAAVLYGEANPSGRMPVTTYATTAQAGDIRSYDMTGGLGRTYRYLSPKAEPLYPFGFGLSYTRWRYSELRASPTASASSSSAVRGVPGKGSACTYREDDAVVLRLNLTNAGEVDGAEVAQLYVGFGSAFEPRADISAHVPLRQLADFKKLFLRAGCNPR